MKIYTLDERCIPAMEKVREYYLSVPAWRKDVEEGKMFGVLIYGPTNEGPQDPPPYPSTREGSGYNRLVPTSANKMAPRNVMPSLFMYAPPKGGASVSSVLSPFSVLSTDV